MNLNHFTILNPTITHPMLVRICIIIFCFALNISKLSAQGLDSNPGIFYEVTKAGVADTSWLFGTYHLVNDAFIKNKPNLQSAFNKSKSVIVEVVMDNADMTLIQSMGMLKDKQLTDLLQKSFADSLNAELKNTLGIGVPEMNQVKPINVMITLSMVYLMKNNPLLKELQGVPLDGYFANTGENSGKEVISLETITEQMEILFNKMTDEEQVRQLELFLRNKETMIRMGDNLLKSWFENDLIKINGIYEEMCKITGKTDYLIKDRNNRWMKTLPQLIKSKSRFIAVGALHLSGMDGLITQLRKEGFTVKPIKL